MKNGPYSLMIAPDDYPGKKYRGRYAYEHSVVYWQHYKRVAKKGQVIHHKNSDKRDNRIENLELISESKHLSEHQSKPWTYVFVSCFLCKKIFRIRGAHYRSRTKTNKGVLYCNRTCQVKAQHLSRKHKAGDKNGNIMD